MELNKDTRDRIFAAADQLYDQTGRATFPTVDAVRKAARVNMNDASAGMKDWRRAQTAQAAPVAVQVPEAVQQVHGQALAALWQAAVDLANESLRAAQAGWEAERVESEALNKQLGDAYETQAAELEALQSRLTELDGLHRATVEQSAAVAGELADTRGELATAKAAAERAEARSVEIERRAGELRAELDHAHQEAARLRGELAAAHQEATAASKQVDALRGELATVKAKAEAEAGAHQEQRKAAAQEAARQAERFTKTQAERDEARQASAQAREEAAALRGELHAMKEQRRELLESLKPSKDKAQTDTGKAENKGKNN